MGADTAWMDVGAVRDVAAQFDASARVLDAALVNARVRFDAASAGRAHMGSGDALRAAVEEVGVRLRHWAQASAAVGTQLRESAERYRIADASASAQLR